MFSLATPLGLIRRRRCIRVLMALPKRRMASTNGELFLFEFRDRKILQSDTMDELNLSDKGRDISDPRNGTSEAGAGDGTTKRPRMDRKRKKRTSIGVTRILRVGVAPKCTTSSASEEQTNLRNQLEILLSEPPLSPGFLLRRLVDQFSSTHHRLDKVFIKYVCNIRPSRKKSIERPKVDLQSEDRPDSRQSLNHVQSESYQLEFKGSPDLGQQTVFESRAIIDASKMPFGRKIVFELCACGPRECWPDSRVSQLSKEPAHQYISYSSPLGVSTTLNRISPIARSLEQHAAKNTLSPQLGQEFMSLAFETADRYEPEHNVVKFIYRIGNVGRVQGVRPYVYGKLNHRKLLDCKSRSVHRAFVAFGSNIGDRVTMIEKAMDEMERQGLNIVETSSLWETSAMYVTDQNSFINGVCEVSRSQTCGSSFQISIPPMTRVPP
jgi:hypothetical protein